MISNNILINFFDKTRDCPVEIQDCNSLRSEYFTSLDRLKKTSNCKNCDIVELKNLYIKKIKLKKTLISFRNNLFDIPPLIQDNKKILKEYFFLYPYKIIFQIFEKYVKIISFKNNVQKVFIIKKLFFFYRFKNSFFFMFFKNFLFYFWFCKNSKNKTAYIYSLNFNFFNKYFLGKK